MMKGANCIARLLLVGSLFGASAKLSVAAQAHVIAGQHGGQAAAHMSAKGAANTNGQWSADPERGWVRAEERKKLTEQRGRTTDSQATARQNKKQKKL